MPPTNVLIHEYFRVDLNGVWTIVERNLPDLKHNLEIIIATREP
ncbi:HepT-like ribonuclease domain-containing protein [Spirulina sp. CS-785/01]